MSGGAGASGAARGRAWPAGGRARARRRMGSCCWSQPAGPAWRLAQLPTGRCCSSQPAERAGWSRSRLRARDRSNHNNHEFLAHNNHEFLVRRSTSCDRIMLRLRRSPEVACRGALGVARDRAVRQRHRGAMRPPSVARSLRASPMRGLELPDDRRLSSEIRGGPLCAAMKNCPLGQVVAVARGAQWPVRQPAFAEPAPVVGRERPRGSPRTKAAERIFASPRRPPGPVFRRGEFLRDPAGAAL